MVQQEKRKQHKIAIKAGVAELEVDTQNDQEFGDHTDTPAENVQVRQSSRAPRLKRFKDFVPY